MALFGSDASYGPNQVALIIASAATMLVGWRRGMSWQAIQDGMVSAITVSIMPMMIFLRRRADRQLDQRDRPRHDLLRCGAAGSWCFLCRVAVIRTGLAQFGAWTVAGTLGIGLMGIANTYSLSPAVTAGAVISGAYFGDKLTAVRHHNWRRGGRRDLLSTSKTCCDNAASLYRRTVRFHRLVARGINA